MNSNSRKFGLMAVAVIATIIIFFLILLFAGRKKQGDVSSESGPMMDRSSGGLAMIQQSDIENGKKIYMQQCASCHGDNGKGDGPLAVRCVPAPANFASGVLKHGSSPDAIFKSISNGIKGTMMASYGFIDEKDRWAVTHYVLTLMPENKP